MKKYFGSNFKTCAKFEILLTDEDHFKFWPVYGNSDPHQWGSKIGMFEGGLHQLRDGQKFEFKYTYLNQYLILLKQ